MMPYRGTLRNRCYVALLFNRPGVDDVQPQFFNLANGRPTAPSDWAGSDGYAEVSWGRDYLDLESGAQDMICQLGLFDYSAGVTVMARAGPVVYNHNTLVSSFDSAGYKVWDVEHDKSASMYIRTTVDGSTSRSLESAASSWPSGEEKIATWLYDPQAGHALYDGLTLLTSDAEVGALYNTNLVQTTLFWTLNGAANQAWDGKVWWLYVWGRALKMQEIAYVNMHQYWCMERGRLLVGVPVASGAIEGAASGSSTAVGSLLGSPGVIVGSAAGVASSAATIVGLTAMAGSAAGVATVSGTIVGVGVLVASSAGAATVVGSLVGSLGILAGTSSGVATVAGNLTGSLGILAGSSAGVATVDGALVDAAAGGAMEGSAAGVGSASATIVGTGVLVASAAGVATVSGVLSATGVLAGAAAGSATVSGAIVATGVLEGSAAGVASSAGVIVGAGIIVGSSSGTGTASAVVFGIGFLEGSAAGVATAEAAFAVDSTYRITLHVDGSDPVLELIGSDVKLKVPGDDVVLDVYAKEL
jgi:hypothetical protein